MFYVVYSSLLYIFSFGTLRLSLISMFNIIHIFIIIKVCFKNSKVDTEMKNVNLKQNVYCVTVRKKVV